MKGLDWEPWEDAVIAREYPNGGYRAALRVLSHRTRGAVSSRANKLGIAGQPKYARPRKASKVPGTYLLQWSPAEREACRLLREWRGPVNRESPLAWRVRV